MRGGGGVADEGVSQEGDYYIILYHMGQRSRLTAFMHKQNNRNSLRLVSGLLLALSTGKAAMRL